MAYALEYIGGPGQWIAGVPAADCEVSSKAEADRLVASGIYRLKQADKAPADEKETDNG